jgi:thiosulfate/3-mercaptopyruvate sulfurtransferase
MRRRLTSVLVMVSVLLGVSVASADPLLVDPAWLKARLGDARIRIVDMTTEPEDYQKGHIPGAVYLHVNDVRIGVPAGGFRLPTADEAARLLRALGIARDTHVVIYDDAGGLHASRLFFTLDVMGHTKASLLDGGIQAWRRARLSVTNEIPKVAATDYRPTPSEGKAVSADWVKARLGDKGLALVDARTPAEYQGKDVRAKRGGHIPGAVNIEWKQNLRADLTFKPLDELRTLYAQQGVTPDKTVVTYCQTHHRAAHTYFTLRLLGYPRVVGYDRSWIEWGNREDLPAA